MFMRVWLFACVYTYLISLALSRTKFSFWSHQGKPRVIWWLLTCFLIACSKVTQRIRLTGKGKETNVTLTSPYQFLNCFLLWHDIVWDHKRISSLPRRAPSCQHCRANDDWVSVTVLWLHISCKDWDEEIWLAAVARCKALIPLCHCPSHLAPHVFCCCPSHLSAATGRLEWSIWIDLRINPTSWTNPLIMGGQH